jgi:hypothetical protein
LYGSLKAAEDFRVNTQFPSVDRRQWRVSKKNFFSRLLYIKRKKKNFSFSRFCLLSGTFTIFSLFTDVAGRERPLLPRPNPEVVQTTGPRRPKATRPSV